ncbi:hypothetical protein FB107DRAFT_280123 [Schizophyllum commune]
MSGIKTRAQTTALRLRGRQNLTLCTVKAVRAASSICRLNRTYAQQIDKLVISLDRDDFISVIDHIHTILSRAVNVATLHLLVERLPKVLQSRLYARVVLPHLFSLTVNRSSLQALRNFLHTHHHSIRDLTILDSERRSTMTPQAGLPLLNITNVIGPTTCVANILPHCNPAQHIVLWLTAETHAVTLQRHYSTFQHYIVQVLCIFVQPRDYNVLATLAMCFPQLRCLKIIEQDVKEKHVWSSLQTWIQALQGLAVLTRLTIQVPRAIDAGAVRVVTWFPYGTTTNQIEFKVSATLLGTWYRTPFTNKWNFVEG